MRDARHVGISIVLAAALGCTGQPEVSTVRVAAAADLRFALEEIVGGFHDARPEIAVETVYGSSGAFHAQIVNGAPFDLYFSADVEYVRKLAEEGLTAPGSEFVYAVGRIVVWAPRDSPYETLDAAALADPRARRVAIANPDHAPYGRAAVASMRSLGVYEAVAPKLVLGENVAQALQFAQSGGADLAVVALSLALAPEAQRAGRYEELPFDSYPRMEQGGAVLAKARDRAAAEALRDYALSANGRATLARWGFLPREAE